MSDELHEECGVVAIFGHPEAANLTYLGLYALQHRGQESAGIATSDGREIHCHKGMGHVADIFTPSVLGQLPGDLAIGHTRYSTAGDTVLLNAQPFSVACNKGKIAVAHNGNITNAAELRNELEREGSIFQASSDTEVILHLVARSRERTLAGALREALLQLEGAFSLVFLAQDRIIVARDPHGFRPLALGQMELTGHRVGYVFASETCAFDLIDAVYMNEVEPGEMVIVGPEGMTREQCAPRRDRAQLRLRTRLLLAARFHRLRPVRATVARDAGPPAGPRDPAYADVVVPVPTPASPPPSATPTSPASASARPSSAITTSAARSSNPRRPSATSASSSSSTPSATCSKASASSWWTIPSCAAPPAARSSAWSASAGAREVHMRISCPPTISPCFYGVDTPSERELIAANNTVEEIRRFIEADSLGYLSLAALREAVADTEHRYCYACYTGNYPTELVNIGELRARKER